MMSESDVPRTIFMSPGSQSKACTRSLPLLVIDQGLFLSFLTVPLPPPMPEANPEVGIQVQLISSRGDPSVENICRGAGSETKKDEQPIKNTMPSKSPLWTTRV